jgi:hypothetical protein
MVRSVAGKYEEDPGILFLVLSFESAVYLRKRLRYPDREAVMKESVHEELSFLGLAEKRHRPVRKKRKPVDGKRGPVDESLRVAEDEGYSLFEGSEARTLLLKKSQRGWIRRLDTMEKVIRGMLRVYGLLDAENLTAMAAECILEDSGKGERKAPLKPDVLEKEVRCLIRCRLGLRTFIRTYEEGGVIYLHHPSITDPERLHYSILASPSGNYRTFSLRDLVRLGEGGEASGAAYLGLLDLLGKHPYKGKGKISSEPVDDGPGWNGSDVVEPDGEGLARSFPEKVVRDGKGWEEEILHIKLRIREGAPNLEIVREVMERLSFEDHQEVSLFLERFISHCDDIPRWTMKGYRMNEI